jgi:choline dehydrogenase-like flavoprotein
MIIDANELDEAAPLPTYDVCVVGSGPAGLAVACELHRHGLRVSVLESGRLRRTGHADALKKVWCEGGIPVKESSRERVVGGASSTWDGLSAPLEPIDVGPRPWVGLPGWPLDYAELRRYYARAAADYGFPEPDLYREEHFAPLRAEGDWRFAWRRITERIILAPTRPPRFGKILRPRFEAPGLDLYTDASVIELRANPSRTAVEACEVRTRGMKALRVRASAFVLAAGGIENARLLLNSTDLCPDGLGNEHGQVGRGFMNHPKNPAGLVEPSAGVAHLPAYFGCLYRGMAGYLALRLDDATQARLGVLDACVRLEPLYAWSDTAGVQLLINYVKSRRWLWERLQGLKGEAAALRDYAETGDDPDVKLVGRVPSLPGLLAAVLREPRPVWRYLFHRVLDRRTRPRVRAIRIRNFMEMEPHPENRVLLAPERDRYGKPLALVRHSTTPLDRRSLLELHRVLAEELQAGGFGRLVSGLTDADPWPINADASHHLGSTRMGTDPRTSVVDADCRLHAVPNLYVAGGSVFPTSGYANPTYTIVALAIRLADHLARTLARGPSALSAIEPGP